MNPALAQDAVLDKLNFSCWSQPKIDGVRALNLNGKLTGRSLDPFAGYGITEFFSVPQFVGFDGEMTLGDKPCGVERLCSLTTGAMGRFKGVAEMPDLHWWIFDYVTEKTVGVPYADRYFMALERMRRLQHPRLHIVPYSIVSDKNQALAVIGEHLDLGYEGTIWRNPHEPFKEGRSDKRQQLLRTKPWQEDEFLCTGITEGDRNENEAKTNTLGRTERSSAKAGKVPNGLVGSVEGTLIKDIFSLATGRKLFDKGLPVSVGAGEMDAKERKHYFEHPEEIVGHIVKFKHLAYGTKDQPRMGTFKSLRLPQDMS